ncbi:MAG: molybdenum cofactor guanylyltransferase [Candidatus Acidiferrum sp.]
MSRYGFVQAGGGSTRFGADKALAKFAGKTMLQRTGELLANVCDQVLVVAPSGKYKNLPWPLVADRWPGQGPLGGILTALDHVNAHISRPRLTNSQSQPAWALMVGCDMPFLTAPFLTFLWERASQSRAQVVVAESGNGLEPLCACWRSDAAGAIQAAFDTGVRRVTEAMKRLPMEVLDGPAWKRFDSGNRLFWNMNTPADFAEARRILETGTDE